MLVILICIIIFLYQLTEAMETGQTLRHAQQVAMEGSRADNGRVIIQNLKEVVKIVR